MNNYEERIAELFGELIKDKSIENNEDYKELLLTLVKAHDLAKNLK